MPGPVHEKRFTSDVVANAAGCPEATIRQWRKRYALLGDSVTGGKETKYYSALDICIVRAVAVLTRYMPAQSAIWFVENRLRSQIERLLQGKRKTSPKFGFYVPESGAEPWFSDDPGDTAEELLANTEGVMVLVDLNTAVVNRVLKVLKLRLPPRA